MNVAQWSADSCRLSFYHPTGPILSPGEALLCTHYSYRSCLMENVALKEWPIKWMAIHAMYGYVWSTRVGATPTECLSILAYREGKLTLWYSYSLWGHMDKGCWTDTTPIILSECCSSMFSRYTGKVPSKHVHRLKLPGHSFGFHLANRYQYTSKTWNSVAV